MDYLDYPIIYDTFDMIMEDISQSLSFRSLEEKDFDIIKKLHEEFFPVRYRESFYVDACKGIGINQMPLFSIVATTSEDEVVGFILAQFLPTKYSEDNVIFSYNRPEDQCYILTLGLQSKYRRYGVGSLLVSKCIEYAMNNKKCGAVYLHVITYNNVALKFYENNNFEYFKELDAFYHIDNVYYSAYLYVYYINGYEGPLMFRLLKSARHSINKGLDYIYSFFKEKNSFAKQDNNVVRDTHNKQMTHADRNIQNDIV